MKVYVILTQPAATLIPTFIAQFNEPADIGWYASAYFLPFALLMPTLGKCYSLWNVKWLFLVSLVFHIGKPNTELPLMLVSCL